jgi:hypothetical protein
MTTRDDMAFGGNAGASMILNAGAADGLFVPRAIIRAWVIGPDGELKWTEEASNLVTNVGKTFNLETLLRGSAYSAAWYVVLKGAGTIAAADTLASHAGWTEVNPYAATNRPTVTFPAVSGGAVTSNTIAITINATATVAGAGICTSQPVATTSGTLYNMTDFASSRGVASGDTLNVTVSFNVT